MDVPIVDVPRVTLIIATYNAASTIVRCLNSVRAQTCKSYQLIVIDGGSTDGTVDILRRHADQLSFWISEPDSGVYHAWNKGLTHARGKWIGFLGADDYFWTDDALDRLVREGDRVFPRICVVYGRVAFVSTEGELIETFGRPWPDIRSEFRNRMVLAHPTILSHSSLFAKHGPFDDSFHICGDYEWLLRELKTGDALFVDGPFVVGMQAGGLSTQARRGMQIFSEIARAQAKHMLRPNVAVRMWSGLKACARTGMSFIVGETIASSFVNQLRRLRARFGSGDGTVRHEL